MDKVVIIPTGDEVQQGLVIDTNSPALMSIVLEYFPCAAVLRLPPVADRQQAIADMVTQHADSDLIIVIGGSGGGKRYDLNLAVDMTHVALESILAEKFIKELYGFNGHLWSRLLVGTLHPNTLVVNVPGPYVEAVAAGQACLQALAAGEGPAAILERIAQAVLAEYPGGGKVV